MKLKRMISMIEKIELGIFTPPSEIVDTEFESDNMHEDDDDDDEEELEIG